MHKHTFSFVVSLAVVGLVAATLVYFGSSSNLKSLVEAQGPPADVPAQGGPAGWTDDGTVVRLTNESDRVGVGAANPTEKLDIIGNISLSGMIDGIDLSVKALDWDIAFNERRQWDGGVTNLNPALGRASLGLGPLSTLDSVSGGVGGTIQDKTIITEDLGVLSRTIYKDVDGPGCHKITVNSAGAILTTLVDCVTGLPEEIILLEQTQQNRGARIVIPEENQPALAQSFRLSAGALLTKIQSDLCVDIPGDQVKIHFYEVANSTTFPDFPNGNSLVTYTIFPTDCRNPNHGGSGGFPFTLLTILDISNTPLTLASNKSYAMVMEISGDDQASIAVFDPGTIYPSGELMLFKNNTWQLLGMDASFRFLGVPL